MGSEMCIRDRAKGAGAAAAAAPRVDAAAAAPRVDAADVPPPIETVLAQLSASFPELVAGRATSERARASATIYPPRCGARMRAAHPRAGARRDGRRTQG